MENSYFDGSVFGSLWHKLIAFLLTILSLGILLPWSVCYLLRWETKHTVIGGKRLYFDGTAMQLFGNWIKWWFLTLITIGIYGIVVHIRLKQWVVKHTIFEEQRYGLS